MIKRRPLTELLRRSYPGCVGGYYSDSIVVALCKLPIPNKIRIYAPGRPGDVVVCTADWEIISVKPGNVVERHFLPDKEIGGQSVENWFHSQFCT